MTTLREAAQQALEAWDGGEVKWFTDCYEVMDALRAALAQQDEPVAVVEMMKTGGNAGLATRIVEIDDHLRERLRPGTKLYTHPAPQRQPLTDEEIRSCLISVDPQTKRLPPGLRNFARAIERAHGIGGQDEQV